MSEEKLCDCPNCTWLRGLTDDELYSNLMAYIMEKLRRMGAEPGNQVIVMVAPDAVSPGTVVDLSLPRLKGKMNS